MASRRGFLGGALAALGGAAMSQDGRTHEDRRAPADAADDALEQGLERLRDTGPEYGGGLANHGPMAAEALAALDRPAAVVPWVEGYRRSLTAHPEGRRAIRGDEWAEALGDIARVGDWVRFFERELALSSWRDAVSLWAPRLAPGFVAAATHGVIRTGHAVRALSRRDTALRRRELAEGLAYWAASFERLPEAGHPGADGAPRTGGPASMGRSPRRGRLPSEALAEVAFLPAERRVPGGFITDRLAGLSGFPAFAEAADLADASIDPSAFVSDLTATFARVYLEQAREAGTVISFIHAVTGPSAVRLLLPFLGAEARPVLLRYAWQAAAGLYAAIGRPQPAAVAGSRIEVADLVDRAVASGDEHAIKFTEACLREHAVAPRPIYLEAARDAVRRLGGG